LTERKLEEENKRLQQNAPLVLHSREIVGIAGVDGNGQTELVASLIGLRAPVREILSIKGKCVKHPTPLALRTAGVAIIPHDRRKEGLALSLSIEENLLANTLLLSTLTDGFLLPASHVRRFAEEQIARFSIVPASPHQPAATLSGGNQQRIIIARELSTEPSVIIAANPSRGLDIAATQYIHQQLRTSSSRGRHTSYINRP
jgi:simple sugar transport system ATP-binding protein